VSADCSLCCLAQESVPFCSASQVCPLHPATQLTHVPPAHNSISQPVQQYRLQHHQQHLQLTQSSSLAHPETRIIKKQDSHLRRRRQLLLATTHLFAISRDAEWRCALARRFSFLRLWNDTKSFCSRDVVQGGRSPQLLRGKSLKYRVVCRGDFAIW